VSSTGSKEERLALESGLRDLGLTAQSERIISILAYLDTLEETNRAFNLTRIPRADYVTLHILDSLTCLPLLPDQFRGRILDVGTGAGFPGVPLAAWLPLAQVTVLDSTAKKVRFVSETAHSVGITNVTGVHGRAEALARTAGSRESFDVVLSRAVAALPKLVELLVPLTKVGGTIVAMKGQGYEDELGAAEEKITALGGSVARLHEVTLPHTEIRRYLIVIKKVAPTPAIFPRKNL
jgi:16S rRNA (guanine527-N7)-methyltransferase